MPADACEKVTLTITVLLSMMVFLLLVANILPDSSDGVPLISKYLLFVFFVNTIQVLIGNRECPKSIIIILNPNCIWLKKSIFLPQFSDRLLDNRINLAIHFLTPSAVICTNFNMRTPSHQLMPSWMNRLFLQVIPPLIGVVRPDDPTPGDREDAGKFSASAKRAKNQRYIDRLIDFVNGTMRPNRLF